MIVMMIIILLMCAIRAFRNLLVKFDFFPATQFLRYKGETEYRTATGGTFTILITILFCILFFNALVDIIDKKNVSLQTDTQHQSVPVVSSVKFGPEGGFLFALSINGVNLSATDLKYFDIKLQLNQFAPISQLVSSQDISLTACTYDHFNFNQELAKTYVTLNGSNLLCPPLNYALSIEGKVTSDVFKRFTVSISKCNSTASSNCASSQQVQALQDKLGYFGLGVVLLNTQLNPTLSKEYQQYYLEEKNFFPFTTTLAFKANAEIEDYLIQTDQSILPFTETLVEKGVKVTNLFQHSTIPVLADTYALIHFEKSSTYTSYTRTYQKLDTLLAYVGGLIGTILGLIFILHSYNEICFQLSFGGRLYRYDDEEEISADQFNFIYYLGYLLHRIFNRLICCKNWGRMTVFTQCQQEVQKQLDVSLLMKKLIYFERVIAAISSKVDIDPAAFLFKSTLYEVKHIRQKYEEADEEDGDSETEKDKSDNVDSKPQTKQIPNLTINTQELQYKPAQQNINAFQMSNFPKGKPSNHLSKDLLDREKHYPYRLSNEMQTIKSNPPLKPYQSSEDASQLFTRNYPIHRQ